jgi:hypothetical protein
MFTEIKSTHALFSVFCKEHESDFKAMEHFDWLFILKANPKKTIIKKNFIRDVRITLFILKT